MKHWRSRRGWARGHEAARHFLSGRRSAWTVYVSATVLIVLLGMWWMAARG